MADRDEPLRDAPADDDGERLFTASAPPPPDPRAVTTSEASGTDPDDPDEVGPFGAASAGSPSAGQPASGSPGGSPPPPPPSRGRDTDGGRPAKGGSFLRELPVLLLIAFLLAFLLRTFVLQVFYIPSGSMQPTLEIDDRMVVEKLTYLVREPRRGEIVVFEGETFVDPYADESSATRVVRGVGQFLGIVPASARDFVKRVIGVEGDEVVIEGGQVFVNGEPIDEPYVVFDDGSDYGPVTVPEGHLFFLGDNRPNSSDSRRSLGFVPAEHVVGRAAIIIWPLSHAGSLTGVHHEVPEPSADGGEGPSSDGEDVDEQALVPLVGGQASKSES
jgi:signal peptidase I